MILPLVDPYDEVLFKKTEKFDFSNPPENPIELYKNLAETMLHHGGIGLAAPQCGLPYNFFVIRSDPVIGMFNAKIVDQGEELVKLDEGCLSYKGITLNIERPKNIKVRYTRPDGQTVTELYTGMTARVIQHEKDHVDGVVFLEKVSNLAATLAIKKANKKFKTTYILSKVHSQKKAANG
jgi:peptide deformylase